MYKRSSRFQKTKSPVKNNFAVFNPHDCGLNELKQQDWIQVGSIDPAIYNFAIRVERWYKNGRIVTIYFSHINFTLPDDTTIQDIGRETFYYSNSIRILEEICKNYLEECHYICIESQLPFAYDMVRMSAHIITILSVYLKNKGNKALILEINPKLKTSLLGAPPMRKKKQVKDWCIKKACELFEEENDTESLEFMKRMKTVLKADDVGDTKCQLQAMIVLLKSNLLPSGFNNSFTFDEKESKTIVEKVNSEGSTSAPRKIKILKVNKQETQKSIDN